MVMVKFLACIHRRFQHYCIIAITLVSQHTFHNYITDLNQLLNQYTKNTICGIFEETIQRKIWISSDGTHTDFWSIKERKNQLGRDFTIRTKVCLDTND